MRAPEIGAPTVQLYSAATEMCAWAENHGALAAVLCEHHGSEDGYLPSPLILAAGIAARAAPPVPALSRGGDRGPHRTPCAERDPAAAVLRRGPARGGHGGTRHHQQGPGLL